MGLYVFSKYMKLNVLSMSLQDWKLQDDEVGAISARPAGLFIPNQILKILMLMLTKLLSTSN